MHTEVHICVRFYPGNGGDGGPFFVNRPVDESAARLQFARYSRLTQRNPCTGLRVALALETRSKRGDFGKSAESAAHSVHARAGQRELTGFPFICVVPNAYATGRPARALRSVTLHLWLAGNPPGLRPLRRKLALELSRSLFNKPASVNAQTLDRPVQATLRLAAPPARRPSPGRAHLRHQPSLFGGLRRLLLPDLISPTYMPH